ncbi:hypothetical protein M426DRAFT_208259 [Hypoxylon sp. CI-4A]|nr:hypothetical protein M426DRAFT_208259 [Hypoxylon sp. CI-4A]
MGIQGLLPLLKSIQRPIELKKYKGETFGVDAYGWLHRGAVPCAIDLAQGKPTRKYVDFAMSRVRMLQHFGITPYLVFDGGYLPSKAMTEASREARREASKKAGLELLKAGKPSQAHAELQKAVDITPEMARHLIEELKKAGIPYVVAPYEADPQLVYLEQQGLITGILSEDSDLLVFGAKRLLTKLDQYGRCIEISRKDFCACREVSLTGWTDAQFRHMAILSGCDYLDSINNLGLKTAHRLLRKHKTPERVVRMLQFDGKYRVPTDYLKLFRQAEQTFLYQWVFSPKARELVNFTNPGPEVNVNDLPFIGGFIEPDIARGIADGDLNPITKQTIVVPVPLSPRKRTASGTTRAPPQATRTGREPPGRPIDSYMRNSGRIPLGEMAANCFTIDPQRVATMTDNGNRPIVYPLPRPYLDGTNATSSTGSRNYINRPKSSSRTLRRRTEPVMNVLHDGGHSLAPSSRRQTTGPDLNMAMDPTSTEVAAPVRPPKKARLCDDGSSMTDAAKEKSKFFPTSAAKNGKSGPRKSTDPIKDLLNELPDFDELAARTKPQRDSFTFDEAITIDTTATKATDTMTTDQVNKPVKAGTMLDRFVYDPAPSSRNRDSGIGMTPPSAVSSSTPFWSPAPLSTGEVTPGTPMMTPLQRLGARAFGRNKQPPTPTFEISHPSKHSKPAGPALNLVSTNPASVPLPPVDLDEVEALHEPVGSEDLMVPESDHEEELDEQAMDEAKKVDLSRFLFAS